MVRKSHTHNRPSPETDLKHEQDPINRTPRVTGPLPGSSLVNLPITPHKTSDKSLEISVSAPLYTDTSARDNLQSRSRAQFHKSRHHLSPGVLSQLPNGGQAPSHSGKTHKSHVHMNDGSKCKIPIQGHLSQWSQSPKTTGHPGVSPIEVSQDSDREEDAHVVAKAHSCPDLTAYEIAAWDCTVTLSTVATLTGDGRLHVHHLALVSVIKPMEELYAEKVSLSLVVANALRTDHKRSLALGQSSLLFKEDVSQPGFFPREGVELVIVRDSCDVEKPLNLYFAFTYPSPRHFFMASLPTFRPKVGSSLSEIVFIAEPRPPLSMRTFIRDPLSRWKMRHHPINQVTCYERINMPRLSPADFQDSIQMRILQLNCVRFRALRGSALSKVIWKLDITVHEHHEGQTECRVSFFIEVGAAKPLVSLIPHGWIPRYFIIDGCVATKQAGECWKDDEGHITIFRQSHMRSGSILVETYWQGPPNHGSHNIHSTDKIILPRIADRKVLGGTMSCQANDGKYPWQRKTSESFVRTVILLNHLGQKIRPHIPVEGAYIHLPIMDAGYSILVERNEAAYAYNATSRLGGIDPTLLPKSEDDQFSNHALQDQEVEVDKAHGTSLGHTVNKLNDKVTPVKSLLQHLVLPLLILLVLVPGFLLFVDYVREEDSRAEHTNWRGHDPSSGYAERQEVIVETEDSSALQPVVTVSNKPVGVEKCEGWRDWIDYEGGWKGCIP